MQVKFNEILNKSQVGAGSTNDVNSYSEILGKDAQSQREGADQESSVHGMHKVPLIKLTETVRVSTTDDNLLDDLELGSKDYKLLEADVFESTEVRETSQRTDD